MTDVSSPSCTRAEVIDVSFLPRWMVSNLLDILCQDDWCRISSIVPCRDDWWLISLVHPCRDNRCRAMSYLRAEMNNVASPWYTWCRDDWCLISVICPCRDDRYLISLNRWYRDDWYLISLIHSYRDDQVGCRLHALKYVRDDSLHRNTYRGRLEYEPHNQLQNDHFWKINCWIYKCKTKAWANNTMDMSRFGIIIYW